MNWLPVLPILVPLLGSTLGMIFLRSDRAQRSVALGTIVTTFAVSVWLLSVVLSEGIQVEQLGNWPAPFGISLVADGLSAIMILLNGFMAVCALVYSFANIDSERRRFGYYSLFTLLIGGVNGAFLTGDIFNLFVWFEILLIASFVLLSLGNERAQLDGAVKYVIMNLLSSALFLSAIAILYGLTGTLNMADLAVTLPHLEQAGLITAVAMMFLVAFGIKAGIFPLFFWMPAAYHTPPVAVSALFAGILTKVGVYCLIRFFTLIFPFDPYTQTVFLWIAGLTMVIGVFGAVVQNEFRRILAFHSVSQVGYMVMGLALHSPLAVAGSVIFMIHHSIVKANLFLVSGVTERLYGTFDLDRLGGAFRRYPLISGMFVLSAFSLAGFPPLSGFWAKYVLVIAGLELEQYVLVAASLFTGVFTLYSMTKIWNKAFWKKAPDAVVTVEGGRPPALLLAPVAFLALATLALGLGFEPVANAARIAAEHAFDTDAYVRAVLGGDR